MYSVMSASDYIRYKRITHSLNRLDKFPQVLTNTQYAEFKGISLEKNMPSVDKYEYWRLLPDTARTMSGILRLDPTLCADYCEMPRPNKSLRTLSLPAAGIKAPIAMKLLDQNKLSVRNSCKCTRTF